MPKLPEVTTTVNGLQKVLPKLIISDVWTDLAKKNQKIKQFKNTLKDEKFLKIFKEKVIGQRITDVQRRAKNILINLDNGYTILIHLKMTGHLLCGEYHRIKNTKWVPDKKEKESLRDPYNRFIHVVFSLSNGKNLVFCDSRKFGKVTLIKTSDIENDSVFKKLGPEPLDNKFGLAQFRKRLLLKPNGKIKTVLMNQEIIAGIGNIYSDEMLWLAGIHPESITKKIPENKLLILFKEMKKILIKGVNFGGDSMSDYRNIDGKRGNFQNYHNVYRRNGEKCRKKSCKGVIIRKVINGRSAHFCNIHQKLFK